MKPLIALSLAVSFAMTPMVSAQGLAASLKDRSETTSAVEAQETLPGTLPRYAGRSAYRAMRSGSSSVTGSDANEPRICNNCDD